VTSAEFVVWREFLGLDRHWVARQFGVNERTVRRWESKGSVPVAAEQAMRKWLAYTAQFVSTLTVTLAGTVDAGMPRIVAPHDDCTDLVQGMPPLWHRMVSARVAERTGFPIVWKN
jgi:hypothetical protein